MKQLKSTGITMAILLLGTMTGFAQNNRQDNKQHSAQQHSSPQSSTINRQPSTRNPNTSANRGTAVARRTGPGTFRTPVNGGNPVRVAYKGAPRYASGVPAYGKRVTQLGSNYRTIAYRGSNYRYYNGVFYQPVGSAFQVIFPPIGIQVNVLPLGYRRIYVGTVPYYYYNGIFYNSYQGNQYVVAEPPLGAKLPELPYGATLVTINGQNYYEQNGTYYVEEFNINNEVLYTVVGVNGVLNDNLVNTPVVQTNAIKTLPPDCKKVNINGQVLYVSPDAVYYQEVLDAAGTISYQVVGNITN